MRVGEDGNSLNVIILKFHLAKFEFIWLFTMKLFLFLLHLCIHEH